MWKYIKDGYFFAGVPARDLTDEEMEKYEAKTPGLKKSGVWKHEAPAPVSASGPKTTTRGGAE